MSSKKQLEDAVKCGTNGCLNCGLCNGEGHRSCVKFVAQTALELMDSLEKHKIEIIKLMEENISLTHELNIAKSLKDALLKEV
jgi:hypothetical protein